MKLAKVKSELSLRHKILRLVWGICWATLFLPSPRPCHIWRRWLLMLFGAQVGKGVKFYGSSKVYYPPNLTLGNHAVVGPRVEIYCVAPITIAENSMVSQYAYLCSASHDYRYSHLPLTASPIVIDAGSWVCARAFIGPGVTVGKNSLVAACSVVVKNVASNQIVGGNPAKFIKERPQPGDQTAANRGERSGG